MIVTPPHPFASSTLPTEVKPNSISVARCCDFHKPGSAAATKTPSHLSHRLTAAQLIS